MWVVVVFMAGDVAAVPFSWISPRINDRIMCFWPLINPRNKIKNNVKPPKFVNEFWERHECRLLFNGATFKTYKAALQKEVDGQKHSNLESQEESDHLRAAKRKHPKVNFSSDSDENSSESPKRLKLSSERVKQPAKSRKQAARRPKLPVKCSKDNAFSSDDSSDNTEYVFIKTGHTDMPNMTERSEEPSTAACSSIFGNANEVQMNEDATTSSEGMQTVPEEVDENTADIQTNEICEENSLEVLTDGTAATIAADVELIHQQIESINTGTGQILLETIDFSDCVADKILQKISEVLQNQSDFKKVLVDVTYRLMKVEHQVKKLTNTPVTAIYRELGLPIKGDEKYIAVQVALEDDDNYEKLVNYASSFQEATPNEFVRRFLTKVFDMQWLYDHIVWRADANKIEIKGTKLARCMFDVMKLKFRELNEKQAEETAIVATRKLKDCHRHRKK